MRSNKSSSSTTKKQKSITNNKQQTHTFWGAREAVHNAGSSWCLVRMTFDDVSDGVRWTVTLHHLTRGVVRFCEQRPGNVTEITTPG